MYIERKLEMDQEVNEATAALKGLLGIGSSGSDIIISKPEERSEAEIVSPEQSKTKKKRNKKNKKKQDETEKTSPKPPKPQQQSQNEANAQKGKNNNNNNSGKKKGPKKKNKNAENFAWSAFQSSPDASKLPIPAFSSPVQSRKTISAEHTDTQPNNNTSEPSVTAETNSTQSKPPATPVGSAPDSTPTKEEESATGVNLAVLASYPPPDTPNDAVVHSSLGSSPAQLFGSPPAYHASPHPPFSPMQYSYLPPPPPGHVTIQVQVPPVLMPGRQMVVTSPAGYPVQIVVPEGYQAGMIIPVFVPAAPPLQHMLPTGMPYAGGYYNANVG
ncbi:hypothetical protein FisN_30Lh050 [Fistulifera solaris]|uniref:Uncharacterized protein n=1 Tax=Fistulifera solaris TaxID=1519565 RepID=A0A1Z5JIU1_FISSO|nr:hypothetical protein FisN_30Lh050 [Fistulifera solaris]|eukprot:GAX13762.1 hypothetical protein FisN_30Lh050 [Fistulifera solaris]